MAYSKTPPSGGRGPSQGPGGRQHGPGQRPQQGPQGRPAQPRSASGRNAAPAPRTPANRAGAGRDPMMGFGMDRPEPPRRQEMPGRMNDVRQTPPPPTARRRKAGTGSLLGTLLTGMAVKNLASELGQRETDTETVSSEASETAQSVPKQKKIVVCEHCLANTTPDENNCCEYCGSPLDVEE